LINIF